VWNADKGEVPAKRRQHISTKAPRRRRGGGAWVAIAGTAAVAVLAVVVVVLAYRVGHRSDGPTAGDLSALEQRVDELGSRVDAMQATVKDVTAQAKAALTKASKSAPKAGSDSQLSTCLAQVQRQIDDLQAYLAYRTPPRRDRVSGACLRLLQPRFKG
jgi:hypothetical protein